MINEAAKILAEGVALRASDIDLVLANGYGFLPSAAARSSPPTQPASLPCSPTWRRCTAPPASAASRRRWSSSWRKPDRVSQRGTPREIGERIYAKCFT